MFFLLKLKKNINNFFFNFFPYPIFLMFFPNFCLKCEKVLNIKENVFCKNCLKFLQFSIYKFKLCSICSMPVLNFKNFNCLCENYLNRKRFFTKNISCYLYDGFIQELIIDAKFNGRFSFWRFVSIDFINCLNFLINNDNYLVIPVPISKKKRKKRKYNQSEMIIKYALNNFTFPYSFKILKKIKDNLSQSCLSKKKRFDNPKFCYKVFNSELVNGKNVILVDDVFTTGSTINECARILLLSNARSVSSITVALRILK